MYAVSLVAACLTRKAFTSAANVSELVQFLMFSGRWVKRFEQVLVLISGCWQMNVAFLWEHTVPGEDMLASGSCKVL